MRNDKSHLRGISRELCFVELALASTHIYQYMLVNCAVKDYWAFSFPLWIWLMIASI